MLVGCLASSFVLVVTGAADAAAGVFAASAVPAPLSWPSDCRASPTASKLGVCPNISGSARGHGRRRKPGGAKAVLSGGFDEMIAAQAALPGWMSATAVPTIAQGACQARETRRGLNCAFVGLAVSP
jgi:hypothetical protein